MMLKLSRTVTFRQHNEKDGYVRDPQNKRRTQ